MIFNRFASLRLVVLTMTVGAIVSLGSTVSAQRTTTGAASGATGAQASLDSGNPTQAGQTGGAASAETPVLNPDDAFSGGVQRGTAIGQSNAPAVGSSVTSAGGAGGGRIGGGGGGLGGLGAAFNSLFGNNAGRQTATATPPLRTRLRGAVVGPMRSAVDVQRNATRSLQLAASPSRLASGTYRGVTVQVQDRTAVLSGSVRSESERRMSHLMMQLEPGVSHVENRLSVSP